MDRGEIVFDFARGTRIGLDEAIFCEGKSPAQIGAVLECASAQNASLLLTRLAAGKIEELPGSLAGDLDYCAQSRTAFFGPLRPVTSRGEVAIVAAGTSDVPVAREAERTLRHAGIEATFIADVGVAGLWRLGKRIHEIDHHAIVIAVAGMDAAIASVLGGLVAGAVICVPTSVGYGAAEGGRTALNAMLSSCAPGLTVCNIDNGYGAASAAIRTLLSLTELRDVGREARSDTALTKR